MVLACPSMQSLAQNSSSKCTEQCCDEGNQSQSSDNTDCCPNGICNPLVSCNCCVFCEANSPLSVQLYATKIKINQTSDNFTLSDYVSDSWNPPKGS
jgi:hypothetical protein